MKDAIVYNPFFWIMLGGMLISTIARIYMNSSFKNLLDEMMRKNWKAPRLVQDMLDFYQVKDVKLERREGSFNDRYLPVNKTLYISGLSLIHICFAHLFCRRLQGQRHIDARIPIWDREYTVSYTHLLPGV